jgi:hypothetical protein
VSFGFVFTVFIYGICVGMIGTAGYLTTYSKPPSFGRIDRYLPHLTLAFVVVALLAAGPALAQDPTNVPLEIPTNVIFTETNSWIETFAPIAAIGIGITIALAVLGYLGKMIAGAFKG